MYVATATDRPLAEAALKTAGIDGFFRGMITSREAGQTKREGPEIYERALRRLRSTKKDTVVFEDAIIPAATAKQARFHLASIYNGSPHQDHDELRALSDCYLTTWDYEDFSRQFQRFT